jgi:hypothetical protein
MRYEDIEELLKQIRNEASVGGNTRERIYWALKSVLDYAHNGITAIPVGNAREYVPAVGNIVLKPQTETVVDRSLSAGDSISIMLPSGDATKMTWAILIFSTGTGIPTLTLPNNIIWSGDTAPTLEPKTIYRLLFNIYESKVLVNTY